jgi:hypothetical protein
MGRGILALFRRTTNVQPLVDADHAINLSRNKQLSTASAEEQEERRREYAPTIDLRIDLLRRNLLRSFFILASAVVISLLFSHVLSAVSPCGRVWLGVSSLFCFAWATLARLGWAGQSWKGDTVVERLDERIFKTLYWLGTFLGTLALV